MQIYDQKIKDLLTESINKLEDHFEADVIYYFGPILDGVQKLFRDFIEHTVQKGQISETASFLFKNRRWEC